MKNCVGRAISEPARRPAGDGETLAFVDLASGLFVRETSTSTPFSNSACLVSAQSLKTDQRALVTGASGGLGFALVQALLDDTGMTQVHATVRKTMSSSPLATLSSHSDGRLVVHELDLTQEMTIATAAAAVSAMTDRLDMVINAAGLLHRPLNGGVGMPERRLSEVTSEALVKNFEVNAIGPVLVAKHFARLLPRHGRAILANISARVGSISDNRLGGWYSYRASKAAQNMLTRNLAIELTRRHRGLICVALHPGTVDTALSAPFQANVPPGQLLSPPRAAALILAVLSNLTPQDSGGFFAWDGAPISW